MVSHVALDDHTALSAGHALGGVVDGLVEAERPFAAGFGQGGEVVYGLVRPDNQRRHERGIGGDHQVALQLHVSAPNPGTPNDWY